MWINLSMTQSLQGPGKIQEEEQKFLPRATTAGR